MKAWKQAEKEVAEFFGGIRRVRVEYGESVADNIHPLYSIEVKWGKQIPTCLSVRVPTKLYTEKGVYCMAPSKFFDARFIKWRWTPPSIVGWVRKRRIRMQFLEDAMDQARQYNDELMPLVCVKPKGRHGFIIIWEDA